MLDPNVGCEDWAGKCQAADKGEAGKAHGMILEQGQ
jgi:hypothetical protein